MITKLKSERGLALQDLITGAYEHVSTIDFPAQTRAYLLDHLASTEWVSCFSVFDMRNRLMDCLICTMPDLDDAVRHRLSTGGSEKIQLSALLGAVKIAVELSTVK